MYVDMPWASDEVRFWRAVEKTAGCWLWTKSRYSSGYGAIKFRGKSEGAHRASWMLHCGPIPDGACVLHSCDVRACVRPDHLRLGTPSDNSRDAVERGRTYRGPHGWEPSGSGHWMKRNPERLVLLSRGDRHYARHSPERLARGSGHGNAKVNEDIVRAIRAAPASVSGSALARKYGISVPTACKIRRGECWTHVT